MHISLIQLRLLELDNGAVEAPSRIRFWVQGIQQAVQQVELDDRRAGPAEQYVHLLGLTGALNWNAQIFEPFGVRFPCRAIGLISDMTTPNKMMD